MGKKVTRLKTISRASLLVLTLSSAFYFCGAETNPSTRKCDDNDDSDYCLASATDKTMDEIAYRKQIDDLYKKRDQIGVDLENTRENKKRDKLTKDWNDISNQIALSRADWRHGKVQSGQHRLFTHEEVIKFNATDENLPIYLVVVGEVFDVTRGKHYYGEEGGYHAFAGRDGSRAFITGEFNDEGSVPDFEGLTAGQVESIEGWREFYHTDYTYLGKLIGWYWDSDGNPTQNKLDFDVKLTAAEEEKKEKKKMDKLFPGCNSKWSQADGGEVWCSQKSGGIDRDWVGVPRLWIQKRKDGSTSYKKCICIDYPKFPQPRKNAKGEDVYDLKVGDPMVLEVYKSCINTPEAFRCKT